MADVLLQSRQVSIQVRYPLAYNHTILVLAHNPLLLPRQTENLRLEVSTAKQSGVSIQALCKAVGYTFTMCLFTAGCQINALNGLWSTTVLASSHAVRM